MEALNRIGIGGKHRRRRGRELLRENWPLVIVLAAMILLVTVATALAATWGVEHARRLYDVPTSSTIGPR